MMNSIKSLLLICLFMLIVINSLYCNYADETSQTPSLTVTNSLTALDGIMVTELPGSQWQVVSVNHTILDTDTYISLYFLSDGIAWGCATCNLYGGKYTVSDDKLRISDVTQTLLLCYKGNQNQADDYLGAIGTVSSYRITEKRLELFNKIGQEIVVLQQLPEYAMNPFDLIGTEWRCVAINNISVIEGLSITLFFDGEKSASGEAGCFGYDLSYQADGDNIRFGSSIFRKGEMAPELEQQALRYTDMLIVCASYRLSVDRLEIFTARGDVLVYSPQ